MAKMNVSLAGLVLVLLTLCAHVVAAPPSGRLSAPPAATDWDNSHWINANRFMGFVTNHGALFRDLGYVFGHDYGSFYPYTSIEDIESGRNTSSPIYAAGLWMGGYVDGNLRVTISEYQDEYVPGPMAYGTYQFDDDYNQNPLVRCR